MEQLSSAAKAHRPQRLETLCLASLARIIVTQTLELVIKSSSEIRLSLSNIVNTLRDFIHPYEQSCPDQIFVSFLDTVRFISPLASIYVDLAYTNMITSYPRLVNVDEGVRLHFSSQLLEILPLLPAQSSLTELNLSYMDVNDDVLRCLAAAPIAGTLKSLRLREHLLTDAVADCWLKFSSLESLEMLKEVDFTLLTEIGMETVQRLKTLPLRELSFTQFAPDFDSAAFFKEVFHPASFTDLTSLRVEFRNSHTDYFVHVLLDLISRRSDRDKISKVQIHMRRWGAGWPPTHEELEDLAQLCPNVELHLAEILGNPANDRFYVPAFKRRLELSLPAKHSIQAEEDLERLSISYPELEKLIITHHLPVNIQRMDYFSNLCTLDIITASLGIQHWPSSLRCLLLTVVASEDAQSNILLNGFIDTICNTLVSLRELSIFFESICPSLQHIQQILARLTNLEYLNIGSNTKNDNLGVVVVPISHPNLPVLPMLPRNIFTPIPVWMPRLRTLSIDNNASYLYTVSSMPNLRSLRIESLPANLSAQQLFDQCPNHFISSMIIYSGASLSLLDAEPLCKLRYLNHLILNTAVPPSFAAFVLKNLVLLSSLTIQLSGLSDNGNTSWLQHAQLKFLFLTSSSQPSSSSNESTTQSIEITSATLPRLRRAKIKIYKSAFANHIVMVANLPHLIEFDVTTPHTLSLSIENCPALQYIRSEEDPALTMLKLCQLPRLMYLNMSPKLNLDKLDCSVQEVSTQANVQRFGHQAVPLSQLLHPNANTVQPAL